MPDVINVPVRINTPNTLRVGTVNASQVAELMHGSFNVDFGALATGGGSSATASASVPGMTTGFSVFCFPRLGLGTLAGVAIVAAAGIADGISITASNLASASQDPVDTTFSFIAVR